MYLSGNGCQKIKRQLEKDGDLTAMGKSLWHYTTIGHILKNRLYCGELEYRKEYVPDYPEQKRAKTKWHTRTDFITYTYKCYDQTRTGRLRMRQCCLGAAPQGWSRRKGCATAFPSCPALCGLTL